MKGDFIEYENNKIENLIMKKIRLEPRTIQEISEMLGIHRVTASKYLAVMEAKGMVKRKNVGKAKLFMVMKK